MHAEGHLSQLETLWSVVRRAHGDRATHVCPAQQALLERYGDAARRYLRACLRSDEAADEVYQDFAVRLVRGDFRGADPGKGRFRGLLKCVLYRMAVDHQRARQRTPTPQMPDERIEAVAPAEPPADDETFRENWRAGLLAGAWRSLEREQQATGTPHYAVLRYRVDHPDLRSPELAAGLSRELGREMSASHARVLLHRARERFAELLVDLVAQSLAQPDRDALEEELIELRLLEYCRPALARSA
jgi:RNA polymerase sigma-70 factor (ECF subfamily)